MFLFQSPQLDIDHKDTIRQKSVLREAFSDMADEVDHWLEHLDDTAAFYFDSITQLELDDWSRGRVTLVGDAGYCRGPAVGGSTSLAVVGAYVLAGELARAGGHHTQAFAAYQSRMREPARSSREFARTAAKTVVPRSPAALWAVARGAQLVSVLPAGLTRAVAKLNSKGVRLHDSMQRPDFDDVWQRTAMRRPS